MATDVARSFCFEYFKTVMAGVDSVKDMLPKVISASEAVVSRLVSGGNLYIASVRPDFASEGYIRSGGLMMLKEYHDQPDLSAKDVVVVGWTNTSPEQDLALVGRLKHAGAFVVGIGPVCEALMSQVDVFIKSTLSISDRVLAPFGDKEYPFVSLQNLVLLWVLTGELVGALTRLGEMPTMYQSVLVPGARTRNAQFHAHRFHPTHSVNALAPGLLGTAYVDKIKSCLETVCEREGGAIQAVARICADVVTHGHHIHAFLISHFPVHQMGAPGDLKVMKLLEGRTGESPDVAELEQKLKPGDLFFFLGYYRRPVKAYEVALRVGCPIVEIITGTDEADLDGPLPDYVIRPGWHYTDSLVDVPGYDVRILPASGFMQAAIYWGVVGEMAGYLKG